MVSFLILKSCSNNFLWLPLGGGISTGSYPVPPYLVCLDDKAIVFDALWRVGVGQAAIYDGRNKAVSVRRVCQWVQKSMYRNNINFTLKGQSVKRVKALSSLY